LAPVHELGHYDHSINMNCETSITGWTHTATDCAGNGAVRIAGFWFETLVWGILSLFFLRTGRFFLGYVTGTYIFAFLSSDLNTPALDMLWAVTATPVVITIWWWHVSRAYKG
jgi:hypothetical protein